MKPKKSAKLTANAPLFGGASLEYSRKVPFFSFTQLHDRDASEPRNWSTFYLTAAYLENQLELAQDIQCRGEYAPDMVRLRIHVEPFPMWQEALKPPLIHYISLKHPNTHELTNHIQHPSQEPCWLSAGAQERHCADGMELSRCRQVVFPGFFLSTLYVDHVENWRPAVIMKKWKYTMGIFSRRDMQESRIEWHSINVSPVLLHTPVAGTLKVSNFN